MSIELSQLIRIQIIRTQARPDNDKNGNYCESNVAFDKTGKCKICGLVGCSKNNCREAADASTTKDNLVYIKAKRFN